MSADSSSKLSSTKGLGLLFLACLSVLIIYSCKDTSISGSFNENLPPKTHLTINEVNRSGANRLSSQINVSWWGDDPDGFIIGYEYSFNDENNWRFTKRTDSVFVLPIPVGNDTSDVVFRIRAIDNDSLRDITGASVVFPIKNSTPTIVYKGTEIPSDTTYSIFNFGWQLADIDGLGNINRIEVELNESANWVAISPNENFMTVNILNDKIAQANGDVYFGLNYRNAGIQLNGFQINGDNKLVIRAIDNAGAISVADTVKWFIKQQTSRVLVLHDYATQTAETIKNLHLDAIEAAGISAYDLITITDGLILTGSKVSLSSALPRVIDPTLVKMMAKWDFIYFFSSDLNRNVTYLQEMTTDFRENGGKIFANIQMGTLVATDALFSFFPMQSFSSLPDSVDNNNDGVFDAASNATSFRLPINRYATSENANWDSLRIKRTITGVSPMDPAAGATILYEVPFQYQVPSFPRARNVEFLGSKVICAKNSENNIIYFSLDFNDIEVPMQTNLGALVQKLCVEELGFSSN
ncbi:MAG: hypothetical protein GW809_05965 [Bacteroidetes bacterium]|nr:hypothetical protein [Bacteroidota bacterium]NCQ11682.1 hypothetical protein [Bacteroidota bacterium]